MNVAALRTVAWQVQVITRRYQGGFKCELQGKDRVGWTHRATAISPEPLGWDQEYTWEELQPFPLWADGARVPKERAPRPARAPRTLVLRLEASDFGRGEETP